MTVMQTTALMPAMPSAFPISPRPTEPPSGLGASRGMSISSATTARSCSRRTEKVARPWRDPLSPRSCSTWSATAVEDSAMAPPTIMLAGPGSPNAMQTPAIATLVTRNWLSPSPNTYFRMLFSRSRLSSRPILNSKNTTPNSARCCTAWTSCTTPSACGPMTAPPVRNPNTGLPPGSLHTRGTKMTLVKSNTSMSITPRGMWTPSGAMLVARLCIVSGQAESMPCICAKVVCSTAANFSSK
mmetsp:Transcript_39679/g.71201  ORF Transcript_39679/g.71201 Transcript_39679/m.71201 type:complete len:242 (-) Transcript_39679:1252-1977(-)